MLTKTVTKLNVPGPKAKAILARDHVVVSHAYGRVADLVMSHGLGSQVYDVDGNRFIDFVSGIAVNSTGHSHPHVVRAIQQQAEKFLHISSDYYHEAWVRLSERLDEIAPFTEEASVFLGNSGTEAVEGAIKLARYHTGRPYFVGFMGGFHGRTLGSLGFTASKITQRRGFMPMREVTHIPYPYEYRPLLAMQPGDADYGETVVNYLEKVVFKSILAPEDVAAVLVEPIQGEGGYVVPPASFFPRLREVCDQHGILLIVDEVQTGMGRTGKWWAIEHTGVEPDMVCTAKGIASGVPLGGFLAKRSLATWPVGAHGNTYGGNPIAAVAALATMDVLENGGIENAATQGAYMMERLGEMAARHPSMGDVRGVGLMVGVEFVQDKTTKAADARLRNRIVEVAFEHGLLIMGCGANSMRMIPPLVVTRAELDEGLEIFEHAVTIAENELL
ncbi:MAG: acetyl ornithine aminotransferase family protein [Caldilinea sp.]|nr:acetyl ornithine aminotransferase family protein [Caldilineaceae bacterium]MCB9121983.1 acetyl ornithine aminotransferase family protein [Caldilineaceae bacterium]MCB9125328.1 acetyl ornithine aminotransferase family protein [Caldilineaceae bacterium]MCO5212928.1 acetyl ornithine aminotransferase family protein [Caldilinea sp.]MCW5840393.1 acetyl ornithine aminotransferase family protein [Caldilinea sp.]